MPLAGQSGSFYKKKNMEKQLIGKMLIRVKDLKVPLKNGANKTLTLTGMFIPQNFNIDEIEGDEMWVAEVVIKQGGKRYTSPKNNNTSPEDFLSGEGTKNSDWYNISLL